MKKGCKIDMGALHSMYVVHQYIEINYFQSGKTCHVIQIID